MKSKHEKRIDEIAKIAMRIKAAVATVYYIERDKEELRILEEQGLKDIVYIEYMPTPFDIAKSYGIRWKFIEIEGNEPSYLMREEMTVYISEKYRNDNYATRQLLAHELGHFFLHDKPVSEMNIFPHRVREEYEANVFSIFLMPQIAEGAEWEKLSPKKLNKRIYDKILKKGG